MRMIPAGSAINKKESQKENEDDNHIVPLFHKRKCRNR